MAAKRFNTRAMASLLTAGGFLVMSVTGIVLFVVPPGRVANWVDWAFAGLGKEDWGAIHITSSLLFVLAGLVHLALNWKPFFAYMHSRLSGCERPRAEFVAALAATVLLVAGTIAELPPFTYIIAANEWLKESWSLGPEDEPPFGHAEEVTLKALADKTHADLARIMESLRTAGLKAEEDQTLRAVADANSTSPAAIYQRLRPAIQQSALPVYTPAAVEERFGGTGIGKKTLFQAVADTGVPPGVAARRLAEAGVQAGGEEKLKEVADRHGTTPVELFKAALVEGYRPAPASAQGSER